MCGRRSEYAVDRELILGQRCRREPLLIMSYRQSVALSVKLQRSRVVNQTKRGSMGRLREGGKTDVPEVTDADLGVVFAGDAVDPEQDRTDGLFFPFVQDPSIPYATVGAESFDRDVLDGRVIESRPIDDCNRVQFSSTVKGRWSSASHHRDPL